MSASRSSRLFLERRGSRATERRPSPEFQVGLNPAHHLPLPELMPRPDLYGTPDGERKPDGLTGLWPPPGGQIVESP
jgi:hypothetical protein